MAVKEQVAAILFLVLFGVTSSCDVEEVAVYKVSLRMLWTEERFPKDFPLYRPKAQWSQVFGQSHNKFYVLYRIGEVSRLSVREFSQYGKLDKLVEEGDEESRVYDQLSAPAVGSGSGVTENLLFVDGGHSFVSLMCRMIPSPDWFVGVDSLDLCVDSAWVDEITLDLEPLDGGAASGFTFTAPRWETSPPDPVTKHKPRSPNHPAAGFYYPELRELPAIAKVEFTKVKQYSTVELNNLARKELLSSLRTKGGQPASLENKEEDDDTEIVTKSYIDQLKDLEEDPVGTPRPNLPENKVIVVTTPSTTTTTTTENEFDSGLESLDDVVLAVAHGRRLGLGKHLPRHFRSRLHHAVNKITPADCLVSEWSEWTPCSVTCGFGDQFRSRQVVRAQSADGRKCPSLTDRKHCGDVNSCVHIDYFEW